LQRRLAALGGLHLELPAEIPFARGQ